MSLSSMIVSDIVTLKERGKWQGMIGACVGIGNMSGPFIAAAFVQKSTWRGFFWLLSPIAAVCAVLCLFVLPTPVHQPRADVKTVMKRVDYGGIFFGSAALLLLLIPIAGGGDYFEWDSPMVISMLVLGGCCVLIFVYIEHKVAVLPMMPRKFVPFPNTILRLLTNASIYRFSNSLQIWSRIRHADSKLPLRNGRLLANLLPPPLHAKRTPPLSYHLRLSHAPHFRFADFFFHRCGSVHVALRPLRRSHLDRFFPVDPRRRTNMHLLARHATVGYRTHPRYPGYWYWCSIPTRARCTTSTLFKSSSCNRHLQPQFHQESWRCGWSSGFGGDTPEFAVYCYAG